MIGTVHAKVSMGRFTFLDPEEVVLRFKDYGKRRPLDPGSLPPTATAMVTVLQRTFSQAIGPMGKGMHWVTFEGAGINSCGPGVVWIDFAGEEDDYRTPIPGWP